MLPVLRILPLALSIAAVVCLAVVFAGCTSSSSPQGLFFLKVNVSEFPKADLQKVSQLFDRHYSVLGLSDSAGNVAQDFPENVVGQVSDDIHDVSEDFKIHLPDYFAVGLWGYCEGSQSRHTFSNCSKPSASFSFDLTDILGSRVGQIDDLLPDSAQTVLKGYRQVSKWAVGAYIVGFIGTIITIILGLIKFPFGNVVVIVSSTATAVFVVGASISTTAIYGLIAGSIKSTLQPVGIRAGLGTKMLVATWLAGACSTGTAILWIVGTCCCCL